jgi:hypothetical protein
LRRWERRNQKRRRLRPVRQSRVARIRKRKAPFVENGAFYYAGLLLRGELAELVAVFFLELAQRPVSKLSNPLPGYPHHATDLL